MSASSNIVGSRLFGCEIRDNYISSFAAILDIKAFIPSVIKLQRGLSDQSNRRETDTCEGPKKEAGNSDVETLEEYDIPVMEKFRRNVVS